MTLRISKILQTTILNLMKTEKSYPKLWKHCGIGRNCSFMSHFFFSHSVFKRLVLWTRKNQGLYRKGLRGDQTCLLNSLPNDKIFDWSKLKTFADDIIKKPKMMIFVFDRIENVAGEMPKSWLPAFSPFSSIFSKGFLLGVAKNLDYVVKIELNLYLICQF